MASVEGVIVREALYEDTEKILEIDVSEEDIKSKEFDDLEDDLEDGDIFDDEDTHMFVAENDAEEVIGFVMLSHIDKDGEGGGMISDMRVDKSWRDAGVYEMMYQHVIKFAKKEAEMKYIRTTVNKFPEGTKVEEICKLEYIAFEGEAKTLVETLQSVPGMDELPLSSVRPCEERGLRSLLRPGVAENILTNGHFFGDGDSFTLCKDNLYYLFEDSCACVFVDNKKPIKSISFGNDIESDDKTCYDIEVNCKDVELMKSHILKQMQDACELAEGHILFSILTLDFKDEIREFCKKIEGLKEVEQYNEKTVWSKIILESD